MMDARMGEAQRLMNAGDAHAAVKYCKRSLQMTKAKLGNQLPALVGIQLRTLGNAVSMTGKHQEAHDIFEEALKLLDTADAREQYDKAMHAQILGGALCGLAESKSALHRNAATEEVLALRQRELDGYMAAAPDASGPLRIRIAICLMGMGETHGFAGDDERALELVLRAKKMFDEGGFVAIDADTVASKRATCLQGLADTYMRMGRNADAEELLQRSGEDRGLRGQSLYRRGEAIMKQGRPQEALPLFEDAMAHMREQSGESSPVLGPVLLRLGMCKLMAGGGRKSEREAVACFLEASRVLIAPGVAPTQEFSETLVETNRHGMGILMRTEGAEAVQREAAALVTHAGRRARAPAMQAAVNWLAEVAASTPKQLEQRFGGGGRGGRPTPSGGTTAPQDNPRARAERLKDAGNALFKAGAGEKLAIQLYDQAIAACEGLAAAHSNRGLMLARLGSRDQARAAYLSAAELAAKQGNEKLAAKATAKAEDLLV